MLNVIMLSVVMLNVANNPFMPSVIMLNVANNPFMLSVIMLNAVMLSVVAPFWDFK
jgi:hypothetical protein